MERASDEQILALFEELTDDTNWDHPRRRWTDSVGGSVQASREFANFARTIPDRALPLIRRFQAGRTERPAAAALALLAKDYAEPVELVNCIHELDARGFNSENFRIDAAQCLGEIARRAGGLDDQTCGLLEEWISDWVPETDGGAEDEAGRLVEAVAERDGHEEDDRQSLLWDNTGGRALPHGNYPYLEALKRGYLCREPHAVDQWLEVLERHLCCEEDPAVWQEMAEDLWRLIEADRPRAVKFFESFLSLRREVLRTVAGVSLIARVMHWLPAGLIESVIDEWISGSWRDGPQAAGEILALRLCRNPDDTKTRIQIDDIVSGVEWPTSIVDGLRLGITHTFIAAWPEPALRTLTTKCLVKLAATEGVAVGKALGGIFRKAGELAADDHTGDLLDALLEQPNVLQEGGPFLVEGMKGLLRDGWRPRLVHRVISALITKTASELGDIRSGWSADAGELADIALTLHRIPETRAMGLQLFERLMEARSYGLDERLSAIDRTAFR